MSRDKQIDAMYEDVVEVFDEEYGKRNLITPQYTAEKLTAKGYRKASEVARDVLQEVRQLLLNMILANAMGETYDLEKHFAEIEKKYTEGE